VGSKMIELICPICEEKRMGVKKNSFSSSVSTCKKCSILKAKHEFKLTGHGHK
jgi:hypothetical protein